MNIKQRLEVFVWLGNVLNGFLNQIDLVGWEGNLKENIYKKIKTSIDLAYSKNGWFTRENVVLMLSEIAKSLSKHSLEEWISNYKIPETCTKKKVAIIMAGNVPLVGFHDLLSVLISGNKAIVKFSSDDEVLPKLLIDLLVEKEPSLTDLIEIVNTKLPLPDAVIATGSNNSARYFKYYFGKYPHIIRKNRHSIAILNGLEKLEDLRELGKDIFQYFGLGCRNVSKLYVPVGYNFENFFEAIFDFGYVINNKKYGNNYDYNRAIYLLNNEQFLDNNFMILKESTQLGGPVAVLYYEQYKDEADLGLKLSLIKDQIQCRVSSGWYPQSVLFGKTQSPMLMDYADGVDTLQFLLELSKI